MVEEGRAGRPAVDSMEIVVRLAHSLVPFARDVLRVAAWFVLLMAVFVPLERCFAVHPQKIFRKAYAVDLAYYFLNSLLPNVLLAAPMAVIAAGLHHIVPGRVHAWTGSLPGGARMAAALVAGEFGFYWGHRWMHEIPWLWRFHAIHHSAEEMDWLVSSRAHPLDVVFGRLCSLVPIYVLGLARPAAGSVMDAGLLAVLLLGTLWGFFIHANVRWRWEWLAALFSTPAFHHWHHTNDEHVDRNYASMLPFFDKRFGTWYLPKGQWPPGYGIDTPVPARLDAQLLEPLLPETKKTGTPTVQPAS